MRWARAELFELADTGRRDELNDPVRERRSLGETLVRHTPYGGESAESDGNRYEDAPMTFVTPASMATVRRAELAAMGDETYRVTGRADLGRMRLLTLQRERGGGDGQG